MKLAELKGKKILIVGKGVEGMAVLSFLKTHLSNSTVDIVDQKDGPDYLEYQRDYDLAVKSPGVNPRLITIPYTTATNIFFSNAKGEIIGVTGTKGKSTTATLIYEILQKGGFNVYLGGNIGQSPLKFMDILNDQSWTILEMSSFQLQDVRKSPNIAVVLMTVSEHLDYHSTAEAYVSAKRNILRFQTKSDLAIINRDYPASIVSARFTKGKVFWVSRKKEVKDGCFVGGGKVVVRREGREETIIEVEDILLPGRHNLENVCAAVMTATLCRVSKQNIVSVIKTFKGLEHRLELVGEVNGVRYYNDSLATVPQATMGALEALGDDVETLIAGGFDRGQNFKELGKKFAGKKIKTLILFPPTGEKIWQAVCKAVSEEKRPKKFDVFLMQQAIQIAAAETTPGKICLLSPSSASFGLFKNYKDRGEQFKEAIHRLDGASKK